MFRSTRTAFAILMVALTFPLASVAQTSSPSLAACSKLQALKMPDTTITAAEVVSPPAKFGSDPAHPVIVQSTFCRVAATLKPTADSDIGVEVWLPAKENWNGKFLGTGNGGAAGSIVYGVLESGVELGYATANTDTGSGAANGLGFAFGIGHPEKQIDFAYRAIHLMTVVGKRMVESFYGNQPQASLFTGCSAGGYEALGEAERFPNDYNGILAGDPAANQTGMSLLSGWDYVATHKEAASEIPREKLQVVNRAVMAQCDGIDGLVDGVIDDARRCRFDPQVIECVGADAPNCLTSEQVQALRKVYDGPRNPRTHELLFPGPPPGSEASPAAQARFLGSLTGSSVTPAKPGTLAWVLGPDWKEEEWFTFDWDKDVTKIKAQIGSLDNYSTDLSAFKQHGGKLILYSGWADPLVSPVDTVDYYESVEHKMGGAEQTIEFARLFMVPGMYHCAGGPGPNSFGSSPSPNLKKSDASHSVLLSLDRWVSRGAPPEKIVATKYVDDDPQKGVAHTRPLCVFPRVARWIGTGSIDEADNFVCVTQARAEEMRSGH